MSDRMASQAVSSLDFVGVTLGSIEAASPELGRDIDLLRCAVDRHKRQTAELRDAPRETKGDQQATKWKNSGLAEKLGQSMRRIAQRNFCRELLPSRLKKMFSLRPI